MAGSGQLSQSCQGGQGRMGQGSLAGMRAGAGSGTDRQGGGGGTCMFLHKNVLRNRLECSFGAEYLGEPPVFLLETVLRF